MLMRLVSFVLLLSGMVSAISAQGTELWMQPDRAYLKYKIEQEEFYKIPVADLWANGMDRSVLGEQIVLYNNGQSVPFYINNTASLSADDYIIFWGEPLDGTIDASVTADSIRLLNPYYNLVDSTNYYYLTWGDETNPNLFRRPEQVNTDVFTGEVTYQDRMVFTDFLNKPISKGSTELRYSHLDEGEGYGTKLFTSKSFDISINDADAKDFKIRVRLSGNSNDHSLELVWNEQIIAEFESEGTDVIDTLIDVPAPHLQISNRLVINTKDGLGDRVTLAFLEWEYTTDYDSDLEYFYTNEDNPGGKVKIAGLREQGGLVFDMDGKQIISDVNSDDVYLPSDVRHEIRVLRSVDGMVQLPVEQVVQTSAIPDLSQTDYLMLSTRSLDAEVLDQYKQYRESSAGGSHTVNLVYIEDLVDQFGFGNEKHFLGLHRFGNYVCENAPNIKHIFIIGKGVEYPFINKLQEDQVYVPTFGFPASDRLLFATVDDHISCAAVGRLAARNSDDVAVYLDKIKSNEAALQNEPWTKKIIHLSGGDAGIQDLLFRWLGQMEKIVEDQTSFGGQVTTYRKITAEPIQQEIANEIIQRIDDGAAMLTFFGHSAVGTFDFNLENASRYQNYGRLPIILSLGCFSGNIYTDNFGLSEQFLLEPKNGAVGFIASSSTAVIQPQYFLGLLFYRYAGEEMYGSSVGQIFQRIFQERTIFTDAEFVSLDEQFIIHGDPAMRLYPKEGPDYTVDFESVAINPSPLEINEDFFELSYQLQNFGKGTTDSIEVLLKHFNAVNKLVFESIDTFPTPKFSDTIVSTIPLDGNNLVGQNRIEIEIDPNNIIKEFPSETAEENNILISKDREIGVVFDIFENGVTPVEPLDFAIVNTPEVTLKVAPINAFELFQGVQMELDTTISFSSPFLKTFASSDLAYGLTVWSPNIALEPGRVYFWRSKLDEEEDDAWETRSFTYLPNRSTGWSQSHVDQFQQNALHQIDGSIDNRLTFDTAGVFINIENKIYNNHPTNTGYEVNFETFAQSVNPWKFMDSGIAVVVGDRVTGRAWRNEGGAYGSVLYTEDASDLVFAFHTDTPESRSDLMDFLEIIPDGSYVLAFTVLKSKVSDLSVTEWRQDSNTIGKNIFDAFEAIGATKIRQMSEYGSVPYNLILRKNRDVLLEDIAQDKNDELSSQVFLPLLAESGSMQSVLIGPAQQWRSLEYLALPESTDESQLALYALDHNGEQFLLDNNVTRQSVDLSINADVFPFLMFEYQASDTAERTFPDFHHWRCIYDPIVDFAVRSDAHYSQTVTADSIMIETAIVLDATRSVDHLAIEWEIVEEGTTIKTINDTIYNLMPNELYNVSMVTERNGGKDQKVNLRINPDRSLDEITFKNNLGSMTAERSFEILPNSFEVYADNQLLVESGSVVGQNSLFEIRIQGSGNILKKLTAFDFNVQLIYPSGKQETMNPLSDNVDYRAQGDAEDEYPVYSIRDLDLDPGKYMLKIEMKSGDRVKFDERFKDLEFEVTDRVGISEVGVYPNPTSDMIFLKYNAFNQVPESIEFEMFDLHGRRIIHSTSDEIIIAGGQIDNALEISLDSKADSPLAPGSYPYRVTIDDVPYEGQLIFHR